MMESKSLWLLLTTLLFIIQGCPHTQGCLEQERIALFQLKSFFNDSRNLKDWVDVKSSNCCQWERVECNITSERVIGLDLYYTRRWNSHEYLNVSLFLPFEELKSLDLSGNDIASFMEYQELKSLTNLRTLDLSGNGIKSLQYFQGEKMQPMMNLEVFHLDNNLLKNNDRTYLKGLSSLKSLSIGGYQLEGSIGIRVLNNLTKLKTLDLSWNNIESLQSPHDGKIPLNLTNLEVLNLDHNSFKNNLLAQLSGLSNLKSLSIPYNKLKGSINIKSEIT